MINSTRLASTERKASDTMLDGLFGGLVGGAAMAAYLVAWGMIAGQGAAAVLSMFDPAMSGAALAGALAHLAVSAVYGIVFGLGWWVARPVVPRPVPTWLAGAIYGLVLLAVAKLLVLPAAVSPLVALPIAHFAAAHMLYGVVLGTVSELLAAQGV